MLHLTNSDLVQRARAVRLLVLDVDGVLTDGKLYFLADGSEAKAFSTLDGQGIKMLQNSGVTVAIITGRTSTIVERRAANLSIAHVVQGREDKRVALDELLARLQLSYDQVAYLGDDLPDLAPIRCVALGIAVANANTFVRQHAQGVTSLRGGEGAARELCEFIMAAQGTLADAQNAYL
ncbi:MAG: HAD hydrolase family protein [Gammaproteobacteria bacterium]|nr:HAD hydrolase family protein [Gammaproteobacteria bacterium]